MAYLFNSPKTFLSMLYSSSSTYICSQEPGCCHRSEQTDESGSALHIHHVHHLAGLESGRAPGSDCRGQSGRIFRSTHRTGPVLLEQRTLAGRSRPALGRRAARRQSPQRTVCRRDQRSQRHSGRTTSQQRSSVARIARDALSRIRNGSGTVPGRLVPDRGTVQWL